MTPRTSIILLGILTALGCSDTTPDGAWPLDDPAGDPPEAEAEVAASAGDRFVEAPNDSPGCRHRAPRMKITTVRGSITVGGDDVDRRWSVVFNDTVTAARYVLPVHRGRDGLSLVGELPEATYDVEIQSGELEGCDYACAVPVGRHDLASSSTLELRAEIARVEGELTVDGEALQDWQDEQLYFHDVVAGTTYTTDADPRAGGTFALEIPTGRYEVLWAATNHGDAPADAPIGIANLGTHRVASDTQLSLDARSVAFQLTLDVASDVMPDDGVLDGEPRGHIQFVGDQITYRHWRVSLGEIGPARVATRVFPGDYAIALYTNDASEQSVLQPSWAVPLCGTGSCRIGDDVQWEVDLADQIAQTASTVRGRVELAGTHDDGCRAGWLTFERRRSSTATDPTGVEMIDGDAAATRSWSTPLAGDGAFAVALPPGEYDVRLRRGGWHCQNPDIARGAAHLGRIDVGGPIYEADFVEPVGRLSGELTVNGAPMPDNGQSAETRGVLQLHHRDGGVVVDIELGASGPATFDEPVLPGTYDARLRTSTEGRVPMPFVQDVLPPGLRALGTVRVHADRPTTLAIDLETTQVRDLIELAGVRDMDPMMEGRALAARLIDHGSRVAFDYPLDADLAFVGNVYPGNYDVHVVEQEFAWRQTRGLPFGNTAASRCYRVRAR